MSGERRGTRPAASVVASAAAIVGALCIAQPSLAEPVGPFETTTRAAFDAELAMPVSGRVVEVAVAPGDRVKADTALVRVDDAVARAQAELARHEAEDDVAVRLAEERASMARADLEAAEARAKEADDDGPDHQVVKLRVRVRLAALEVERARRRRAEARLRYERALIERDRHVLRAPTAGVVERVDAQVGAHAHPGRPVLRLVDTRRLHADVGVPAERSSELRVGDRAEISALGTAAWPALGGRVVHVGSVVDPQTDTRRLRVEIENPHGVPAGVAVAVTIHPGARAPTPIPAPTPDAGDASP